MFFKQAVCISTAAGGGIKSTVKDMADSTFFWGCAKTYKLGIAVASVSWEKTSPKVKAKVERKTTAIANTIKGKAGNAKPGIKTRAFFSIMGMMQKSGWNPADKGCWENKGWLGKKRPWKQ